MLRSKQPKRPPRDTPPPRVFTLLFVGWTLLLLEWHFRQYVVLRQFYLRSR